MERGCSWLDCVRSREEGCQYRSSDIVRKLARILFVRRSGAVKVGGWIARGCFRQQMR